MLNAAMRCWGGVVITVAGADTLRAEVAGERAGYAPDWPPLHWDAGAIGWLLDKAERFPDEPLWQAWYVTEGGTIIGTVGCKGPPGPEGVVEIGYSVVTSRWRQGIATRAVALMLEWLREDARVRGVCAHTLVGDAASAGVLLKNGFVAAGREMEDGVEVDRYERGA